MYIKRGDYYRVLEMTKEGSGYDDILSKLTNKLGDDYAEKFEWDKAAEFYLTSKNYKGLIEAFTMLEDYDSLAQIIEEIPENDPLLNELADRFQLAGMADYAVKCYEKLGEFKKAIDCCVLLNHWNIATELAEKHGYAQIEGLLQNNANELLNKNKRLEAAELYRKANRNTESAKILSEIANQMIEKDGKPLYIKKLYVLAALEVDQYKKRLIDSSMTGQNSNTTRVPAIPLRPWTRSSPATSTPAPRRSSTTRGEEPRPGTTTSSASASSTPGSSSPRSRPPSASPTTSSTWTPRRSTPWSPSQPTTTR